MVTVPLAARAEVGVKAIAVPRFLPFNRLDGQRGNAFPKT
jgi:hypothetical protein